MINIYNFNDVSIDVKNGSLLNKILWLNYKALLWCKSTTFILAVNRIAGYTLPWMDISIRLWLLDHPHSTWTLVVVSSKTINIVVRVVARYVIVTWKCKMKRRVKLTERCLLFVSLTHCLTSLFIIVTTFVL